MSREEYDNMLKDLKDLQFTLLFGYVTKQTGEEIELKVPSQNKENALIENIEIIDSINSLESFDTNNANSRTDIKNGPELGFYAIDQVEKDEAGVSNEECGIYLKENNRAQIYMQFGFCHYGKYEIENDNLTFRSTLLASESGDQKITITDVVFTFKIVNSNKLQLLDINVNEKNKEYYDYENGFAIGNTYSMETSNTYIDLTDRNSKIKNEINISNSDNKNIKNISGIFAQNTPENEGAYWFDAGVYWFKDDGTVEKDNSLITSGVYTINGNTINIHWTEVDDDNIKISEIKDTKFLIKDENTLLLLNYQEDDDSRITGVSGSVFYRQNVNS